MLVILNIGAGTAASEAAEIEPKTRQALENAGVDASIRCPQPGDDIASIARDALAHGESTIVAAGGDGTINAVAAVLADSGATFGVLPLGTLNHFAKDLKIPLDLEGAVATIAAGRTTNVDVAEVNGKVFINNSSLGIYPRIVSHRQAQQERLARGKWPAAIWATLHALRRFPFLNLRIAVENETLARRTAFLFVGNNEYEIAGFRLGGRAAVDRGRLGLYLTHRTGRFGLLRLAARALFGRLDQAQDFESFCVTEATIESRRSRLLVATDGEVTLLETPLHYRTRPGALRVLVPASDGEK